MISNHTVSFHDNWGVDPIPPRHCTFKATNLITVVALNVFTDALLLIVPFPLLLTLRLPARQRIGVALVVCSGLFVILAALIRLGLTLADDHSAENSNAWGVRETIVGVITINMPMLRFLFKRKFWRFGPYEAADSRVTDYAVTREDTRTSWVVQTKGDRRRTVIISPRFGGQIGTGDVKAEAKTSVECRDKDIFVHTSYEVQSDVANEEEVELVYARMSRQLGGL